MNRFLDHIEALATADLATVYPGLNGSPVVDTAVKLHGRCSLSVPGNGWYVPKVFDSQGRWVFGAWVRFGDASADGLLFAAVDNATVQVHLRRGTDRVLRAYRGTGTGNLLGTSSGSALSDGTWYFLEAELVHHASAGTLKVWVDGSLVMDLSGLNTAPSGNASADRVWWQGSAAGVWYQDRYVNDGQAGEGGTVRYGAINVLIVRPTGDGALNQWSPDSGGSRYSRISDTTPDGDTSFIYETTAAERQLCTFSPLALLGQTVLAARLEVFARKEGAADRRIKLTARPAATNRDGSEFVLTTSYALYSQLWALNPDTGLAWTVSQINASQFGAVMTV